MPESTSTLSRQAGGSPDTVRLRIEGMTCGSCVARVERALQRVPGVVRARVNLASETAHVEAEKSKDTRQRLIDAVRAVGYDADTVRAGDRSTGADEKTRAARIREQKQALWQALAAAVPIMALHWLAPVLRSSHPGGHVWPQAVQAILLGMMLASSAGAPILVGGFRALMHRTGNMDLLVSLGVSVAFVAGLVELLSGGSHSDHLHAAAMILLLINLGRYIEGHARQRAVSAVALLARSMPQTAQLVTDDGVREVSAERLQPGDRVRVAQNTLVPVDGLVVEGIGTVDESAITGEFTPREAGVGDEVPAGAILADGLLTLEATRVGAESAIGRVLRAVEDAQAGGTRMQRIADRVAGIFVPIVIVIAFITLVGNGATASVGWMEGVRRAVAVLVIACPCAMGLATPVAVMVAVGAAAGRGILVRDAAALEMSGQIDTMLLDKTGTITTGRPMVAEVFALADATGPGNHKNAEDSLLQLAASAEQYAQHPLARAVVRAAELRGLSLSEPAAFENESGFGVRAVIDRREVRVGSVAYLRRSGIDIDSVRGTIDRLTGQGITVIVVAEDGRCMGVIAVRDEIRPNAAEAIRNICRLGIHVAMLTGDTAETARAVAAQVGLDDVYARLAPEEKLAAVRRLQNEGRRVAFTGDGINDAPALAAADVGITFASATDIAVGAADITIIHDDLERLPCVVAIGRRSVRIIRQNLFWAFVYNVIAIPLAATGKIPPGYAAGAMMASSITVVLNSLRLRNRRIRFVGGAGA